MAADRPCASREASRIAGCGPPSCAAPSCWLGTRPSGSRAPGSTPNYASDGGLAALAVAALAAWSLSSPRPGPARPRGAVAACLAATALVRVGSEAVGINVLGAAALALDVGALAAWAGLAERRRAVSPFWLAVLFAFALPVERIFQRTVGFPLQSASAAGACGLLSLGDAAVVCEGVRLLVNGWEALVDLPCSGASGLVVLLALSAHAPRFARRSRSARSSASRWRSGARSPPTPCASPSWPWASGIRSGPAWTSWRRLA